MARGHQRFNHVNVISRKNEYEPRHAIMCLREINYVMRYDVVKSDVKFISHRAELMRASSKNTTI